jgi:hypothetical protein
MASTELLASKVVILEEEPSIPSISALPSAVALALGITERGPIADKTLITSFEEYTEIFGGFTANGQVAIAAYGFFLVGGSFMWVSRTVHFTNNTDPNTSTAVKGNVMLQNSGTADSPALVGPGTEVEPFVSDPNVPLLVGIDGGGPTSCIPTAVEASLTTVVSGFPLVVSGTNLTMGITIDGANGGNEQSLSIAIGSHTVEQLAQIINEQLLGISASVDTGQVKVITDILGTDAGIQVTDEGTGNADLNFPTAKSSGTGNVGNVRQITALEIKTIVEAAEPGAIVTINIDGSVSVSTVDTGGSATIQITNNPLSDALGLDNDLHTGATATAENTLNLIGKTAGAYTDNITSAIQNATSGDASEFNMQIIVNGVVKEVFANLTMDNEALNFIETVVNNAGVGSKLIQAVDQGLAYSALLKRPATGTSSAMTGGDDGLVGIVDADYIGNSAGPTGLYCFDTVQTGRILIVPGQTSAGVQIGMIDYAESWRNGTMFCILDCPLGYTAAQMVAWLASQGLEERTEFAAVYWPRIRIVNPNTTVFGTGASIVVPYSGFIAGKYASNDQKLGGVYESPAGVGGGWGIIPGVIGVEDDPGGSEEHEVLDEKKRDLIYPKRINPITRLPGTAWHIDGGRTLKSTGNFPNIGERRGVIFIETTLQQGMIILKHRFNNRENRQKAKRIITQFLVREMNKDAFRTRNPATAFFVDVSNKLNPLTEQLAGKMKIRIGLATNKPTEWIIILVTQDTRQLAEELATAGA